MKKIMITICFILIAGILFAEIGLGLMPFGVFDINPVPTQGEDLVIDAYGDSSSIRLCHMMSAYFGMEHAHYKPVKGSCIFDPHNCAWILYFTAELNSILDNKDEAITHL